MITLDAVQTLNAWKASVEKWMAVIEGRPTGRKRED